MIPKLTDEAIAELPLGAGRAELLEEIMSTVAPDRPAPVDTSEPKRRGLLAPLAAAAVVGAIAVSSLWWHDGSGSHGSQGAADQKVATQTEQREQLFRAVLEAPGWTVSATETGDNGYGEVDYAKGGASFQITWYGAKSYASYVEDREHILDPAAPGAPVQVLGRSGQLWAYSADDHTVIREVEDGHWMELRGSGMDEAAYRSLLGELRLVGLDDFEASLPERFVTAGERKDTAAALLQAIEAASGADFPADYDDSARAVATTEQDPYQLGAHVAGTYVCSWLEEYSAARAAGDSRRAQQATDVLATSPDWPVLNDMVDRGDYPEMIWGYADQVAAGQLPESYRDGLGCS